MSWVNCLILNLFFLSNAVPTIKDSDVETNENNTIDTTKTNDTADIVDSINQSPIFNHIARVRGQPLQGPSIAGVSFFNVENAKNEVCFECMDKDDQIDQLKSQIQALKGQLIKTRKKTWYLEKVKRNLDESLSDLKKQNIISGKDCQFLEVI